MLLERPRAYVHLPTASLQLIYDMRLQVPRDAKPLSLFHVDERLEGDQLVARLNRKRPDLYLMPLKDGQPLPELTLKKDQLLPASTRGLWLAEFARQEGWVVRDERVRWKDWVKQQGLVEKRKPETHLQRFSDKARGAGARGRQMIAGKPAPAGAMGLHPCGRPSRGSQFGGGLPALPQHQCLRIFSTIAVVELFSTSPSTFTVPP
jgi:hypothetical protein